MRISGKHVWLFVSVACFFITTAAQSELRDPTRPSGFFQDAKQVTDAGLNSLEGLSLQAIFYRPENPGALINGRRFAVGDQIANAKIKAIHTDHVVLVSAEGEKEIRMRMPSVKSTHEKTRRKPVEGMK